MIIKLEKLHEGIVGKEFKEEYDLNYSEHKKCAIQHILRVIEKHVYEKDDKFINEVNELIEDVKNNNIKYTILELGDYDLVIEKQEE